MFTHHYSLSNNKYFVLIYRSFALIMGILGILAMAWILSKHIHYKAFLTYTVQSNILATGIMAILLIKSVLVITKKTRPFNEEKPFGFYPQASMLISLAILVTMVITWTMLIPFGNIPTKDILGFANLSVHLFMPLLMIGDYLIFTARGLVKKNESYLCMVIPYVYLLEIIPLGLTHAITFGSSYYPYFFLDVDKYGWFVILWIIGLSIVFVGLALGWYYLDRYWSKKLKHYQ